MIRFLTANLHLKAVSLLIALGLWFALVHEPELVTSHSVPVFFKNLPRDIEIGSDVPDRVHIELRGPAGRLSPAHLAEASVLLDLSKIQAAGERTFTVTDSSLTLPPGVEFLRAVPSQLRLRFDRVLSKEVTVHARVGVEPPKGYEIISREVRPARLKITGPENRVRAIEEAQTDPLDLSGVFSDAEVHAHAYVADPQVRFEATPLVTVKVVVRRIHSESR
jgi:YbbR domain-containing protein